jgi:hypothetical protein
MKGISKKDREFVEKTILHACRREARTVAVIHGYVLSRAPTLKPFHIDTCQRFVRRLKDEGKLERHGREIFTGGGWAPKYRAVQEES